MPILNIIKHPNKILRTISKEINISNINNPKLQKLIKNMIKTMKATDGIGIAAPQVGKNIRLIIINTQDKPLILLNPKITKKSWFCDIADEGCLSIPNTVGIVKRPKKIKVKGFTEKGNLINFKAEKILARVLQHEIDHLDGILFIDKAEKGSIERIK